MIPLYALLRRPGRFQHLWGASNILQVFRLRQMNLKVTEHFLEIGERRARMQQYGWMTLCETLQTARSKR